MATLGPVPKAQFFAANGEPLVGGQVWTYAAGTTTPLATYSSYNGVANTNPVILDSRGEASIWYDSTQLYKIVLKDADGVEIYTVDNLSGIAPSISPQISNAIIVDSTINNTVIGNVTPAIATFSQFSGEWTQLPAGTTMLFVQNAAPTGWTKLLTHNNKALRVVSGSTSSGGTVPFTTAFSSQSITGTVDGHALTINEIPSHSHNYSKATAAIVQAYGSGVGGTGATVSTDGVSATGGSQPHTHTFTSTSINLAVQYVDVIIAVKN